MISSGSLIRSSHDPVHHLYSQSIHAGCASPCNFRRMYSCHGETVKSSDRKASMRRRESSDAPIRSLSAAIRAVKDRAFAAGNKLFASFALGVRRFTAFMPDYYHAPALILTALLLPAFGLLYFRSRDTRTLLWFLGFFFALVAMVLLYARPRLSAAVSLDRPPPARPAMQISSALFLGSLSPLRFRIGRFQILYVIPYTIPLVAASILLYGVFHGRRVSGPRFFVFPLLLGMSFSVGMIWGTAEGQRSPLAGRFVQRRAGLRGHLCLQFAGAGVRSFLSSASTC